MGRREGPSEERRAAILAAAEAVFVAQGYSGASVRAIAQEAGVSSALLYWFFPSKADLFGAVLAVRAAALGPLVFTPAFLDLPPAEFLPQLAQGICTVLFQPGQVRLFKMMLHEHDEAGEAFSRLRHEVMGRLLEPLHSYFTHQIAQGRVHPAPPEYLAQAFIGLFLGLILRREILQEPSSQVWVVSDYVATAVGVFVRGIVTGDAAPPGPVAIPTPRLPRRAQPIALDET